MNKINLWNYVMRIYKSFKMKIFFQKNSIFQKILLENLLCLQIIKQISKFLSGDQSQLQKL